MRIVSRVLLASAAFLLTSPALSGESEIRAAQTSIDGQLRAFQGDNGALAYSYAAPSIQRIFPSVDIFMGMVDKAYRPVRKPGHYSFGKAEELGGSIAQQVFLQGPDGKDYEAMYTLELQGDGVWRITGVSLKAATALST